MPGVEVRGASEEELRQRPFWPVIQHMFNSLAAVNPAAADKLLERLEGARPVLIVSDEWVCHYDPTDREIRISTAVIEAMWAATYAYYLLYKQVEGKYGGDIATALGDPALDHALEVFRWALGRSAGTAWPAHFPQPPDPALGQTTAAGVASEMALVCLAFLLLHEIGHHFFRHEAGGEQVEAFQMERDADNFGSDWMLDGKAGNEKAKEKMRLGIIMACGWMVAKQAIAWKRGTLLPPDERAHPWSYSRLFDLVTRGGASPHATSWCMAVAVLAVHAKHVGLDVPQGPFDSCSEAADALVDVFAEAVK